MIYFHFFSEENRRDRCRRIFTSSLLLLVSSTCLCGVDFSSWFPLDGQEKVNYMNRPFHLSIYAFLTKILLFFALLFRRDRKRKRRKNSFNYFICRSTSFMTLDRTNNLNVFVECVSSNGVWSSWTQEIYLMLTFSQIDRFLRQRKILIRWNH